MDSCKKMLGKRIKELRKSRGLTQEKLSELIGLEPNHISKIEAGIHFPQPEKLDTLAQIFEIPVKELFNYEHKTSRQVLMLKINKWLEDASNAEIEFIHKTISNIREFKKEIKK